MEEAIHQQPPSSPGEVGPPTSTTPLVGDWSGLGAVAQTGSESKSRGHGYFVHNARSCSLNCVVRWGWGGDGGGIGMGWGWGWDGVGMELGLG